MQTTDLEPSIYEARAWDMLVLLYRLREWDFNHLKFQDSTLYGDVRRMITDIEQDSIQFNRKESVNDQTRI